MNWSLFKFYSIEVKRRLDKGEDVIPAFESAKSCVLAKEFDHDLKIFDIAHSILTTLKTSQYSRAEVKDALEIYNRLDLTTLSQEPTRIRRVGLYIGYLFLMFFILSSIYAIFVIPRAIDMYETMNIPAPDNYLWFVAHWSQMVLLAVLLLSGAILVSIKLKALFKYKAGVEKSITYRLMLPKQLKRSYERLIALICLPLYVVKHDDKVRPIGASDEIVQHFKNEAYTPQEIAEILSLMLNEQINSLLMTTETLMRRIYVVIAILMIFSIYIFISSGYTPLFILGEIS